MKRFFLGLLGILSISLFISLSGQLSASAVSGYDDTFIINNDGSNYYIENTSITPDKYFPDKPLWEEIKDATYADTLSDNFADLLQSRMTQNNGDNVVIYFTQTNASMRSMVIEIFNTEDTFVFENNNGTRSLIAEVSNTRQRLTLQYSPWQGKDLLIMRSNNQTVQTATGSIKIWGNNAPECTSNCDSYFYMKLNVPTYPEGYEGTLLDGQPVAEDSNWKPDIKLLQGENWLIELSDYNFYTFDKVAFTCGEHELAPVINWEVWDVTDDENRVLIDTLTFGAPALVKYQAPKIQEDKKYEIVAYYSDCENMNFTEASTKQFTVLKDGRLNPTDFMVVCLRPDFPFINIPDCMAEFNDYLAMMSFNLINANSMGGGTFQELSTGCRDLQILGGWMSRPDQRVCPMIPAEIRNTITPFIVFAIGLGVAGFLSRRQGTV